MSSDNVTIDVIELMLLTSHNCNFRSDVRVPILPNVCDISLLFLLLLLTVFAVLWWRLVDHFFVQTPARRACQRSAVKQALRVCLVRWHRLITVRVLSTSQWQHQHRHWQQRPTVPPARRRSLSPTLSLLLPTYRHLSSRFLHFLCFWLVLLVLLA